MMLLAGLVLATALPLDPSTEASDRVVAQVEVVAGSRSLLRYDRVFFLETPSDTSANVSIGDLNGDGNLDILLVKGRHWPRMSRVFLGDGRGHILAAYNLGEAAYRSYSGRLVDLDGDGDLDVVLSNDTPDPKVVCLNDGKGRFNPDCIAFSHESATTITAADFNHDGLIDLAVPNRDGGQSYVYFGGPNANFSILKRVPFGPPDATIRMADAADLDGDGFLDIVEIDERRGAEIYFGQKDGTFSAGMALDNGKVTPYALAVSDLNLDGKIDIFVGNVEAPSTVYFNDGSGRHYTPVHFGDNKGTVYGFATADLDRDGLPDIAVARSDAPNTVYFAR